MRLFSFLSNSNPEPGFRNVIPTGEGYYSYSKGKYRRWHGDGSGDNKLWFTEEVLLKFVRESVKELKK